MNQRREPSPGTYVMKRPRNPDGEFGQKGQKWDPGSSPPPVAQNVTPQTPATQPPKEK